MVKKTQTEASVNTGACRTLKTLASPPAAIQKKLYDEMISFTTAKVRAYKHEI
jgi:hypothetical protein